MAEELKAFQREDRYIVIKRKDLAALADKGELRPASLDWLVDLCADLPAREYVVIESDWPEYPIVWQMIKARMNGRAQLPSQGGEAVEVVASIAVDAEGAVHDFTLEPGLDRHPGGYTVTPLMTVAQHQRILLSTVIRCEQKGAFKICLECGYQDGHDLICQYHESKRAAVSDDLTNVRCLCCQSEHAHNSYDAGFIAGSGMCQACDSALPAKDIVSITHPADQAADDLAMVKVSRELLQDLRDLAFDQVEHHRAAMGAYKQTRQSAMDSVLAQADALLRT